jgi:hypothetical protein
MSLCWALHFAGRDAEAIRETRRTRELAPDFLEAGNLLMNAYEMTGRIEDAVQIAREQPIYGIRADADALLKAYSEGGITAYWRKRLDFLDAAACGSPPMIHFAYAVLHARLGEAEAAISHVERLIDAHAGNAVFVAVDPSLRPLHAEPRFQAAIKRLGVPTVSAPHTVST